MLSTLEKAGRVLRLFTAENPEWGVSQVARELLVSKGSVHDALATLTQIGLVHRTVTGRYRLGFSYIHYWYEVPTITDSITMPPSNIRGSGSNNIFTLSVEAHL